MELMIETPKSADFKKVNCLAKQVHELHVEWRPDLFLNVDEPIPKEEFENLIQNKEIFIAKLENEIVGYLTISINETNHYGIRYCKRLKIDAICVDENYRGREIGKSLLDFAKKFGKENNCTDLYLTVNQENTNAIKVYESFGMKVKNIAYSMEI